MNCHHRSLLSNIVSLYATLKQIIHVPGVAQQGNVQFHVEKPNTTAISPQLQTSQAWTIDEDVLLATDPSDIIGTPIATQNLLSDTTTDILANLDDSH